ncbi:DUF7386 family protein [Natronosalvus hydrolyticus]
MSFAAARSTIQQFNTSVLGLRYRTSIETRWW